MQIFPVFKLSKVFLKTGVKKLIMYIITQKEICDRSALRLCLISAELDSNPVVTL